MCFRCPLQWTLLKTIIILFSIDEEEKNEAYEHHQQLCKAMLLCICYSANIGGTGTLTGTAPQLVLAGQVSE